MKLAVRQCRQIFAKSWRPAQLILTFSFLVLASAQNAPRPLPLQIAPYNVNESPRPVMLGPHLRRAVPRDMRVLPASQKGSLAPKAQPTAAGTQIFWDDPQYPTGTSPLSVAVGDFNGDGKPDLAVANYFDN